MRARGWLIGVLVVAAIAAGLAVYYRDFLQISLLVDRSSSGAMWSAVVRHSVNYKGDEIYCYDEGSQFCENILSRMTQNSGLEFTRQRTLGYAFSPGIDLGTVPHHTLYSCVNLKDARQGTYTYRIATDSAVCDDIGGYPYPLGKVFTQPGDVEVPLPLHRDGAYLATDNSSAGREFILGYISAANINQQVDRDVLVPEQGAVAALCTQAETECSANSTDSLCQEANEICDIPTRTEPGLAELDVNGSGCVGEVDAEIVQAEIGTSATGQNQSSDVNSDGVIDSLDVMAINRFLDNPGNVSQICDTPDEGLVTIQLDEVVIQ